MLKAFIPVLLLAGTATAASPGDRYAKEQDELARELAAFTPGRPQTCIRHLEARSSRLYGNTVLFKVSSRLVYRSDTRGGCANSGFQTAFSTDSVSPRLCAGDAARTFDPTASIQTGACTFGPFVPYRK